MRPVRIALGAAALLCAAAFAFADKGRSEGSFVDAAGKAHRWQVTRSHALLWDGTLYAPAGTVFHSRFLAQPSDAAFAEDKDQLKRLREAGIQDVWVDPGRGLLGCEAAQTQRLVHLLEEQGFRYGLAVQDRASEPLIGYAPQMDANAVPEAVLKAGGQLQWTTKAPGARRVHWALVDPEQDLVFATGKTDVESGLATLKIDLKKSKLGGRDKALLYVVPERPVAAEDAGSFADLWRGTAAYQKQLVAYMRSVKFGPGLRFIINPLDTGDGLVGAEGGMFPSSAEFRADFSDWLKRRTSINDINIRWAMTSTHIHSLEVAGRLVPTWPRDDPPEKEGWLIDPVEQAAYQVVPRRCRIWDDYQTFRTDSLKRTMNQVASAIKSAGPNVPVIYSWNGFQPLWSNQQAVAGYDGIAPTLDASGNRLLKSAGAALSQAEQSSMSWWLVAGRLRLPETGGRSSLSEQWSLLRDAGFKGFFIDPASGDPTADALAGAAELRESMALDQDLPTYLPKVCFYPAFIPNAGRTARLPNGVWWLPSMQNARQMRLGSRIQGYDIDYPFGEERGDIPSATVLWSPTGKVETSFQLTLANQLTIRDSSGKEAKVKPKNGKVFLTLTDTPVVLQGLDPFKLFPQEVAQESLDELDALLTEAEAQQMDTRAVRGIYSDAKAMLSPASAAQVNQLISTPIAGMRRLLSPYQWVEGERPLEHNFSGQAFLDGTSEGRYLVLDRQRAATSGLYTARYVLNLMRDATYDVWIAGRVPGRAGTSAIQWAVDSQPLQDADQVEVSGGEYAPGIAWYRVGQATLEKGRHVVTIAVQPVKGVRSVFGIDALVLAREPFQPKGIEPPEWIKPKNNARANVGAGPGR